MFATAGLLVLAGTICLLVISYTRYFHGSITRTGTVPQTDTPLILFDFDGVLCDSYRHVIAAINENAAAWGYRPLDKDPDNYRHFEDMGFFEVMQISRRKLPLLVRVWQKTLAKRIHDMHPFDGMSGLLAWLRQQDVCMGMVTSNSPNNVQRFLSRNDMNKFDFIYSGTGLYSKNRIFQKIIRHSRNSADNIWYVGDETRDIQAGKKAGIKTISVAWGYQTAPVLKAYNPDHLAESPTELKYILTRIVAEAR